MKKTILQLLFCLVVHAAFGQSNRFYGIIKTHPAAYFVKNYNLGVELGKEDWLDRVTISAFWTNNKSTSPYPDSELFYHGDSGTNFDMEGLTYRFGYKHVFKEKGDYFFYVEPQVRYGLTKGIFNDVYSTIFTDVYDCKIKNTQILGLLGAQFPNKQKTFMIDFYVGFGLMNAAINVVLKTASTRSGVPSVGTVRTWTNKGLNGYIGTSIGIILGKNKKN
jgi:hypothetical protein